MKKYVIKYKNFLVVYVFFYTILLIFLAKDQWFFYDDFDLVSQNRGDSINFESIFKAHNEHTVAVPFLIFKFIFAFFKLTSYLPYVGISLIIFGLTILVLYYFLKKIGVSSFTSFVIAIIYSVNPAYYENTFWAFQMGLYLSVLFGLLSIILANYIISNKFTMSLSIILMTISLFSSSLGLIFAFIGLFLYLFNNKKHILPQFIPLFLWVLWFIYFGVKKDISLKSIKNFANYYPNFTLTGVFETLSSSFINLTLGIIIFIYLFKTSILKSNRKELLLVSSFSLSTLILWALITYGRSGIDSELNLNLATASRYTYATFLLILVPFSIGLDKAIMNKFRYKCVLIFTIIFYFYWGILNLNVRANQQENLEFETSVIINSLIYSDQYLGVKTGEFNFEEYRIPQLNSSDILYFRNFK